MRKGGQRLNKIRVLPTSSKWGKWLLVREPAVPATYHNALLPALKIKTTPD